MRTYEDIKSSLKKYQDELAQEAGSKQPHWIVVGGNMSIIKKGTSNQYVLGKGDPVPMLRQTAESNLEKFQARCGDNIKLSIVKYNDWLNDEINECNHLISCINKTVYSKDSGEDNINIEPPQINMETPIVNGELIYRHIHVGCPSCPYNINSCWTCKFAGNVNTTTIPWTIICMAPKEQESKILDD